MEQSESCPRTKPAHWLRYPNLHSKTSKRYNSKSSDSSQERRTSIPVSNLVAIIPRRSVCVIGLRTKHSPNIASRSPPWGLCISRQVVPVIWTWVSCTFPSDKLIQGVNGFIQNRHRSSAWKPEWTCWSRCADKLCCILCGFKPWYFHYLRTLYNPKVVANNRKYHGQNKKY